MTRAAALAVAVAALLAACGGSPTRSLPTLERAPTAAYLTGMVAAYRNDPAAAVAALTAAATAAPDEPMIAVALARAQLKAGAATAADATLAAARTRWPAHPEVWLASGDVADALDPAHERRAAFTAYARAQQLAPDDERGYVGEARLAIAHGEPAAAEKIVRQLIARVPGSIDGHYRLARLLAARDDLGGAIVQLRAVLEGDPDQLDARLDLARALRRTGHIDEAIAMTRAAFDRSDQALDIAEELFDVLCEAGDRTGAIDLLGLLDDDSRPAEGLALIARLDRTLGLVDDARRVAVRLGTLDAPAGELALAELDIGDGDYDAGAARALAIAVDPSTPMFADARRVAGAALLAAGKPADALAAIEPARAAHPHDLEVASVAATALADRGDVAGARALLAALTFAAPDTATDLAVVRARLEDHLGDTAAVLALLEPALRATPDHVGALNLAGYTLALHGERLDDAARYLRRARDLAPGDPAILDSWGWLQFQRHDYPAAIRALAQATLISPREPEMLVHLAAACVANGRSGSARSAATLLDRALALHPTAEVRRRIDALRATLPASSI